MAGSLKRTGMYTGFFFSTVENSIAGHGAIRPHFCLIPQHTSIADF